MNNCIYFSVNFPPEVGVIVLNDGVRCAGTVYIERNKRVKWT